MLTVTGLAKQCNVSRTTVLYYERMKLLTPAHRSENGYRWYGDEEKQRLQSILSYRAFGLPVSEIATLLETNNKSTQQHALQEQFKVIEREIEGLRQQQKAIVMLLEEPSLIEDNQLTKERWVMIMEQAGFDEQDMQNWHVQFEQREPSAHQAFLESLNITSEEICKIRSDAKTALNNKLS
ncbi:MerR family transcriptional regulator [Vibrio superstes]|uniref:MerR family transcriptional regulator n=1 Tax=Vibrio superstes NBRC 103154 TaxID=1219062 RepID=A0A511QP35_9VIBR|nr:MerR family transcriptional regulator [Vibrio superstes]GEM79098.1 MerR family transcriptional regulator [Vibrio superstes NBRC 103154]